MFSLLPLYDCIKKDNGILNNFVEEIKSNEALVWSIDQGVTDIFTVGGSGSSSSKERIRKTFTKEYYHTYSFNLATQEDFRFTSELSTLKT
ncbi:hypothetical protein G6F43_002025 [Rhizopus delemar]|nr:hypothetical protein G6F43_002025 [Rhizopus delemar]